MDWKDLIVWLWDVGPALLQLWKRWASNSTVSTDKQGVHGLWSAHGITRLDGRPALIVCISPTKVHFPLHLLPSGATELASPCLPVVWIQVGIEYTSCCSVFLLHFSPDVSHYKAVCCFVLFTSPVPNCTETKQTNVTAVIQANTTTTINWREWHIITFLHNCCKIVDSKTI